MKISDERLVFTDLTKGKHLNKIFKDEEQIRIEKKEQKFFIYMYVLPEVEDSKKDDETVVLDPKKPFDK